MSHMFPALSSAVLPVLLRHWLTTTEGTGYAADPFASLYPMPASFSGPARCRYFSIPVSADLDGLLLLWKECVEVPHPPVPM